MPIKLKVLIGLVAVNSVWNLSDGQWIAAILGAALAVGMLKARDGARVALLVVCWIAVVGLGLLAVLSPIPFGTLALIRAGLPAGLAIWCLTRSDVTRWFRTGH